MLKRGLVALLAFCMLLTLTPPAAFASETETGGAFVVNGGTVAAGDAETVIPVTIEKKGSVGLTVLQFDVTFPEELVLTAKPTVGTLFADKGLHSDKLTSPYTISLGDDVSMTNVTEEGVLITLNFTVKADAAPGDYEISVTAQDNYNADIESVALDVTPGKITVTGEVPAEKVTVTFDTNGGAFGDGATSQAVTIDKGATVTLPAENPTRDGYDFIGWFASADAQNVFDFDAGINADATVYAGWKEIPAEQVAVTFDANGGAFDYGSTTTVVQIDKGASLTQHPENPTRAGYDFIGWYVDKEHKTKFNIAQTINADTVIYAGWEKPVVEKVTVTFDGNGGAFGDGKTTTVVEIDKGATVTAPAENPTRDGYNFAGWFTTPDALTAFDFSKAIDANATVYAGWKEIETTPVDSGLVVSGGTVTAGDAETVIPVTIEKKGSVGLTVLQFDVTFPDELVLTAKPTVGTLFADKGLHSDKLTSPYTISLGDDVSMTNVTEEGVLITLNFTVKADAAPGDYEISVTSQDNYNADIESVALDVTPGKITVTPSDVPTEKVTVTFDANGGLPEKTEVTIDKGATVTLPADNPTRESYNFTGWYADANAATKFDFSKAIDANTVIYAGWEKPVEKVTVTFDANGGLPATTQVEIDKGATVTLPAENPTRDGYDFIGWFASADAATKFDFSKAIDANTTVYAGWEKPVEKVTVTFNGNGGLPATTQVEIDKGATVTLPAENPTREGYNFIGWFADPDAKTPFLNGVINADTVVYAGWEEIPAEKVKVTFDGNGGLPEKTEREIDKGATVTAPANPTRSGYSFTGWFSEKAATNKFDFSKAADANTTVYAGWSKNEPAPTPSGDGCYIATSVYGSYDCPEVWTLRRFRDDVLGSTWYGRLFIKAYYATSPTLVKWFGDADWFRNFWRDRLDDMVRGLQDDGFESTPYQDQDWRS